MALTANPLDSLLSDLRTISNESKRKFPPLKEASEAAILKVRTLTSKNHQNIDVRQALHDESVRILEPFIMGCEFKQNTKVVQISLNAMQRMITHQAVSKVAACKLVDCLWTLMENNLEEVKVLQTATLLLSTNNIVSGPVLARTIVLCFRLYNIDNTIVTSIASATIRQLVSNVFERVENEDAMELRERQQEAEEAAEVGALSYYKSETNVQVDYEELKSFISGHLVNLANALRMQYAPRSLRPAAADAFLLLRDLILILNDEQTLWLVGLTDLSKTFVLELLELVFVSFSDVLTRHEEFRFLIKERVCYMILEMFSPDINYNTANEYDQSISKAVNQSSSATHAIPNESTTHPTFGKTSTTTPSATAANDSRLTKGGILDEEFISVVSDIKSSMENNRSISATSMRVLRILSMLIQKFYTELLTSGDIFTAIFTKLLENDSNLKQVSGPLKLTRLSSADTGTAGTTISTVSSTDIPVVTTMISKLFENSHLLKRKHLRTVVAELCQLSISPYVIAKLLELGLVNLNRIGCIWDLLTEHFIEISRNQNLEIRDWGACALTHLIKQACNSIQEDRNSNMNKINSQQQQQDQTAEGDRNGSVGSEKINFDSKEFQMNARKLLKPLQSLSQIQHPDIRQKQLDVVLQVIQSATSESALGGWPQLIDIIGTVDEWQTENLNRIAFQCLQGIVSDYMTQIDCECVVLIIAAIVKFTSQLLDSNVSLTAIGLLWSVADYLHQNKDKIENETLTFSHEDDAPNLAFIYEFVRQSELSNYDSIWMALFSKLSEICIDPRPAIRKSACQTLFALITTHGDIWQFNTWQAIPWQILFPLLHQVRTRSCVALDMKVQTPTSASLFSDSLGGLGDDDSLNSGCDSIVMHHSRNTAQKQWSETQVLALTGVTKVFTLKREKLSQIQNFNKAWNVLLEFLKTAALSKVFEVSLAALKCFQDLLAIEGSKNPPSKKNGKTSSVQNESQVDARTRQRMDVNLWLSIWVVPIINLLPLCDESMSSELREDFARCCFEALLQFSNFNSTDSANQKLDDEANNNNDADIVNKLAVDCLLNRFSDVIIKYNHDERLAGKCPLPRHRMSEIVFVLRAMTTLLRSLKKVPTSVVGARIWEQVLSLYPHLIDFATRNSPADQVKRDALNEVLLEYGSLLKPPSPISSPPSTPLPQPPAKSSQLPQQLIPLQTQEFGEQPLTSARIEDV